MVAIASAVVSGLLAAVAFPTILPLPGGSTVRLPNLAPLAWFALVPLFLSLREARPGVAFRRGLLYGAVFYALSFYWVDTAMRDYGHVSLWASLVGLTSMVAIFSSIIAAAMALASWLRAPGVPFGLSFLLCWIAQDYLRNYFPFGGFSWSALGYSQAPFLPLIQILDLTGIYGVTALVLAGNVALGEVWRAWRSRGSGGSKGVPLRWVSGVVALVGLSWIYGSVRIRSVESNLASRPQVRLGIVQASIPQDEKWLTEMADEIITRHLALTREVSTHQPDLILWPEAAFPVVIPPGIDRLEALGEVGIPLLIGAVSYEGALPATWPPPRGARFALHNSAFVVEPGGLLADSYHKNHLVPMGEYVPLPGLLTWIDRLAPVLQEVSSFTPGKERNLIDAAGARIGVTICFEDLFPEISRDFSRRGADLFVNLTNDAWYGHSSALWHHFDFSRFRAIENRRTLVRAANTGVTGVFDATGRVVAEAPLLEAAVVVADVRLGGPKSLYAQVGDLFAWSCLGALTLLGWFRLRGGTHA